MYLLIYIMKWLTVHNEYWLFLRLNYSCILSKALMISIRIFDEVSFVNVCCPVKRGWENIYGSIPIIIFLMVGIKPIGYRLSQDNTSLKWMFRLPFKPYDIMYHIKSAYLSIFKQNSLKINYFKATKENTWLESEEPGSNPHDGKRRRTNWEEGSPTVKRKSGIVQERINQPSR